ncbi:hypothetical protein KKA15_05205 [Patescibacteria group bacterium]|nr:hypothetical protein [Patescibacteria group bacterium]
MALKTHKTTSKKIKLTNPRNKDNEKLLILHGGQNHFNARESGKTTRHKRRKKSVPKSIQKTIKKLLPYS